MYFFQSLPIPVPQSFFKSLNKNVREFLWNNKTPRVSMEKRTWDYCQGGLKLPNFKLYYLSAQMRFISFLFKGNGSPSWVQIEMHALKEMANKFRRLLEHCYEDGLLMSFEQLKRKCDLSNKHFFCYLQLRNYLINTLGTEMTLPVFSSVEDLLHDGQGSYRFISKTYSLLLEQCPKTGIHKSRERRESDLQLMKGFGLICVVTVSLLRLMQI